MPLEHPVLIFVLKIMISNLIVQQTLRPLILRLKSLSPVLVD